MKITTISHPSRIISLFFYQKDHLKGKHFESLDGLRAIAALLVLFYHVQSLKGLSVNGIRPLSDAIGGSAVYLFFVLSSFLLTSQLLRMNFSLQETKLWINYASKRLLRIYPLYIFILLIYTLSHSFKFSVNDVINHIILLEGDFQFWTIPVEMKYYLILPLITLVFINICRKNLLTSAVIVVGIIIVNWLYCIISRDSSVISILPSLPAFLIGSLTALIHLKLPIYSKVKFNFFHWNLEIISVILLLFGVGYFQSIWWWAPGPRMPFSHSRYIACILFGCLWSTFLVTHLYGIGFIKKLLSFKILRWLGKISFGIYLWHPLIIGYLDTHLNLPEFVKVVCIFSATMLLSTITYSVIERPFMQIKFSRPLSF